jgi:hypothetical protein
MKKGGLFLIGMLVVGLVFMGCSDMSGLFDDIFGDVFGTEADSGEAKENYDLSTNWSEDQWRDWFNYHRSNDSDALNAVATFRSDNYYWVSNNPWWEDMHTTWMTGGHVFAYPAANWSQGTWQRWFDSHSPSNSSDVDAVHSFYLGDSWWVWTSNNSWWLPLYAAWAGGGSGTNMFVGTWSNGSGGTVTFNADFTVYYSGKMGSTGIYTCTGTTTATVTFGGESFIYHLSIYGDSFYWGDGIPFSREDL